MMSFLQTGKALYVLAAICLAGVFTRLMAGSFYKRLIKRKHQYGIDQEQISARIETECRRYISYESGNE